MNIDVFHKVSLQGLIKNRTRTFVTIIGVILSSALITAVFTFAVSLQKYMINGAVMKYGDWHISFPDASSAFIQDQADNDKVEKTFFYENIGYARLEGGTNEYKPYLFLAGFNEKTFHRLPVNLISGRLPQNDSEVLVPAHVSSNGGVKISVGDTLTLTVGVRQIGNKTLNQHNIFCGGEETFTPITEKTYTVVGICQRPVFEERSAPGYTLITKSENASSLENSLTGFVTLKNPYGIRSYKKSLSGYDTVLNDDVLRFMGVSEDKMFNTLLYSIGGILTALIMLGSVFMIYNSFHISLNERTHQFGILMSIGATEKQLRNSVLFEGLCIGAVGIPIGIFIGLPSIRLVLSLVSENFANIMYDNVPLTLTISAPVIAAAVIISMITILISAYIPAKKASAVPIMECIRQTGEIKIEAGDVKTPKYVKRIYGLEGMLALKNFKRNKRRYRSIILSLILSVVLFVSADSFGTYLKQATEQSIIDSDYDIRFAAQNMEKSEAETLYERLKTVDGIYESSCLTLDSTKAEFTFQSLNPRQSAAQMQTIIDEMGITSSYTLYNLFEIFDQNRNLLFIVNLFTVVFIAMISLIAVANVFNTISTNIKLRRRELAMIRSVGMSDLDFNKMMCFECIFYGLRTLLFGLPVSGLFSWLIYLGISGGTIGGTDGFHYAFPWSSIGISLCGVFLVIFITTLYAVSKIKKENIIDALRDDMA